jgi:Holliday junction resolvasome RuvABC endonuclease subunit
VSSFGGIDISSFAVDLVFLDEETNHARWRKVRLDTGPGNAFDRCRRVRALMPPISAWEDQVLTAAIEKPMSVSFNAAAPLMRVQGAVIACLPRSMPLAELRPDEWKTACGLKGNADKSVVRRFVLDTWDDPPIGLDENACDAYAIAWAWRELCDKHSVPLHAA